MPNGGLRCSARVRILVKIEWEEEMFHLRRAAGAWALSAIVANGSAAREPVLLAAAKPGDVGLSSSPLARIQAMVQSVIIN